MNCEEFAKASLGGELYSVATDAADVREHLRVCPSCAALFESLLVLKAELRDLGFHTSQAEALPRVEMRLRQEYRTVHHTKKMRSRVVVGGWLLAAATLILGIVSWLNWHQPSHPDKSFPTTRAAVSAKPTDSGTAAPQEEGGVLIAANSADEFALLPGAMPGSMEDATVVRVQMQRGALGALGLTINEEHAADVVQVDLLVGSDGQPQGYRLPETTN